MIFLKLRALKNLSIFFCCETNIKGAYYPRVDFRAERVRSWNTHANQGQFLIFLTFKRLIKILLLMWKQIGDIDMINNIMRMRTAYHRSEILKKFIESIWKLLIFCYGTYLNNRQF